MKAVTLQDFWDGKLNNQDLYLWTTAGLIARLRVVSPTRSGKQFIVEDDGGGVGLRAATSTGWSLVKQEPVPHWPAVINSKGGSGYLITDVVFPTVESAQRHYGDYDTIIRLATEYPPIMLVPEGK